jgi:uncharacterized SAM-binding protein YcdF (DUF218 family)
MSILAAAVVGRSAGLARLPLVLGIVVLWGAATPILSDSLGASLEWRSPPVAVQASPSADAIVVLGGAVEGARPPRCTLDLSDHADRVLHAARLYRAGKAPLVLVSAGYIPWLGVQRPEAESIRVLLQEWGVPDRAIVSESTARNTHENAVATQGVLEERGLARVLLVTSALHMPRALATFRSAGIDAVPAPTDFTVTERLRRTLIDYLPDARALSRTTDAVKEYIGYAYYGWKGRIAV